MRPLIRTVQTQESVDALVAKLLVQIRTVDEFAYSQQVTAPGFLSGCCAKGIVPRDEPGACKVCDSAAASHARVRTPATACVSVCS